MRARLSRRKDIADQIFAGYSGYYRPPYGFFLWLKVGDGVALTRRLWRDFALKVIPGAYLTQDDAEGINAGRDFMRVALVHDPETTVAGLSRIASGLGVSGNG